MKSGGSNFNDIPQNKFWQILCSLNSIKANWDHGVPRVILFKAIFFSYYYC